MKAVVFGKSRSMIACAALTLFPCTRASWHCTRSSYSPTQSPASFFFFFKEVPPDCQLWINYFYGKTSKYWLPQNSSDWPWAFPGDTHLFGSEMAPKSPCHSNFQPTPSVQVTNPCQIPSLRTSIRQNKRPMKSQLTAIYSYYHPKLSVQLFTDMSPQPISNPQPIKFSVVLHERNPQG